MFKDKNLVKITIFTQNTQLIDILQVLILVIFLCVFKDKKITKKEIKNTPWG